MDTSETKVLTDHIPGRYEVYGITPGEKADMKCLVSSFASFNDALVRMSDENSRDADKQFCIYDIITQQFFDPGYVYSQEVAREAMNILTEFIGNKGGG